MDYATLVSEVGSLTNHPEMVAEIASAVKASTLRMHQLDYYERDLEEAKVVLPQLDFIQQFDATTTLERFRHIKYARLWFPNGTDPLTQQNTGAPGAFFKILSPEEVLTQYKTNKDYIAYLAGRNLNFRAPTQYQFLLLAWYKNPLVFDTTRYSSWIADQVPYAIIFDAASIIFQTLAMQEQARKYDALVEQQVRMVQSIGIAEKGK
jgi:hypothetical protein